MDQWLGLGIFLLGAGIGGLITHIAELRHNPGFSNEVRHAKLIHESPGGVESELRGSLKKGEIALRAAILAESHPSRSDV